MMKGLKEEKSVVGGWSKNKAPIEKAGVGSVQESRKNQRPGDWRVT